MALRFSGVDDMMYNTGERELFFLSDLDSKSKVNEGEAKWHIDAQEKKNYIYERLILMRSLMSRCFGSHRRPKY